MRRPVMAHSLHRRRQNPIRGIRVVQSVAIIVMVLLDVAQVYASPKCSDRKPLYVPLETVREHLDLRGESRTQYLDRRYGAGRWRVGGDRRLLIESPGDNAPLTLRAAVESGIERVDLIVEARLEVLTVTDRRSQAFGHRDLASYPLARDAQSTIEIPISVFQEPGALVIVLHGRSEAEANRIEVFEWPYDARACEAPIYTEDRFTAIRLNRRSGR